MCFESSRRSERLWMTIVRSNRKRIVLEGDHFDGVATNQCTIDVLSVKHGFSHSMKGGDTYL